MCGLTKYPSIKLKLEFPENPFVLGWGGEYLLEQHNVYSCSLKPCNNIKLTEKHYFLLT